ncbi:MAG: hypothetical protein AB4080_09920 [Trichodesmium sp.]
MNHEGQFVDWIDFGILIILDIISWTCGLWVEFSRILLVFLGLEQELFGIVASIAERAIKVFA